MTFTKGWLDKRDEIKKEAFNSAQFLLTRLDEKWRLCEAYRTAGLLRKWNSELDGIYLELYSNSDKTYKVAIKNLNNEIVKCLNSRNRLYQILIKKAKTLKKLEDAQGKGSKYDDTENYDFD